MLNFCFYFWCTRVCEHYFVRLTLCAAMIRLFTHAYVQCALHITPMLNHRNITDQKKNTHTQLAWNFLTQNTLIITDIYVSRVRAYMNVRTISVLSNAFTLLCYFVLLQHIFYVVLMVLHRLYLYLIVLCSLRCLLRCIYTFSNDERFSYWKHARTWMSNFQR